MQKSLLFFLIALTSARFPFFRGSGGFGHPGHTGGTGDLDGADGTGNTGGSGYTGGTGNTSGTGDLDGTDGTGNEGNNSWTSVVEESSTFSAETTSLTSPISSLSPTSTTSLASGLTVTTQTLVDYETFTFKTLGTVIGSLVETTTITKSIGEAPHNMSVSMSLVALWLAIISFI